MIKTEKLRRHYPIPLQSLTSKKNKSSSFCHLPRLVYYKKVSKTTIEILCNSQWSTLWPWSVVIFPIAKSEMNVVYDFPNSIILPFSHLCWWTDISLSYACFILSSESTPSHFQPLKTKRFHHSLHSSPVNWSSRAAAIGSHMCKSVQLMQSLKLFRKAPALIPQRCLFQKRRFSHRSTVGGSI